MLASLVCWGPTSCVSHIVPGKAWIPLTSTEAGQSTWRLSVKWECPWTSMLVFTVGALGMFAVPLAAGACGIYHEISSHPLLSQGTVSR